MQPSETSVQAKPVATPTKLEQELESRRRSMQKAIQQKVAELRAQGADEPTVKGAVNKMKKLEQQKILKLVNSFERAEKGAKHDVIIIPVEWRRHEQETEVVDSTAQAVKQALMSTGLDAWLDGRRQYTPGQKFAYWEHLGVKHRVEIGPEDIKQECCRIVRADKPGAYLEHQRLNQVPLNARAIVSALVSLGLEVGVDVDRISDEPILADKDPKPEDAVAGDWEGNVGFSKPSTREKQPSLFGPKRGFRGGRGGSRPY